MSNSNLEQLLKSELSLAELKDALWHQLNGKKVRNATISSLPSLWSLEALVGIDYRARGSAVKLAMADFSIERDTQYANKSSSVAATDSVQVLTKDALQQLSKKLPSLLPKEKENLDIDARSILESLLHTAEEPRLSAAHRAAVCDALCGFLERGAASRSSDICELCLSTITWTRTFKIYLTRSADAQAKPMKQVLTVLLKLLLRMSDYETATILVNETVKRSLYLLYTNDDTSCIRAAMNIMDQFLDKRIITAAFFIKVSSEISPDSHSADGASRGHPMVRDILELVPMIVEWLHEPDVAPAAGRLLGSLFKSIKAERYPDGLVPSDQLAWQLWLPSFLSATSKRPELVETLDYHVLPGLLRIESAEIDQILAVLPINKIVYGKSGSLSEGELGLCIAIVKVSEDLGIVINDGLYRPTLTEQELSGLRFSQSLSLSLFGHSSSSIRIAALKLFIYMPSSTGPMSPGMLSSLPQILPLFHAESDSKTRNEFSSIMKKFFSRLQQVLCRLLKTKNGPDVLTGSSRLSPVSRTICMGDHLDFLIWYIEFVKGELHPAASYQRHISALVVLRHLTGLGLHDFLLSSLDKHEPLLLNEPEHNHFYNQALMRQLLDLVLDPFDDVRNAATTLLEDFPATLLAGSPEFGLKQSTVNSHFPNSKNHNSVVVLTLQRAEASMRRTGRADHADGVGRLYSMLYAYCSTPAPSACPKDDRSNILECVLLNLENDVRTAQNDLQEAILSAPLHGHLIALRYIIGRTDFYHHFAELGDLGLRGWRDMQDRITRICTAVWVAVREVLCFDSPEGHVVIETEDDEPDVSVKDTLSFCWRSLKEASSVMQAVVSNATYGPPESSRKGLTYMDFKTFGDLAFEQLAELRHRGAFSTVSQTFSACCMKCSESDIPAIAELPKGWYQQAILCIQEKAAALTRRSAGLPAMMTGILVAYTHGAFLDDVILGLQNIASAPLEQSHDRTRIRLPQVHALNCLKDVFTHTRLGPATETHVEKALVVAVGCLDSDEWAIRNCGLMLLKALLTRLVGGSAPNKNNKSYHRKSKLIYEKYPILADLVVQLLRRDSAIHIGAQDIQLQAPETAHSQFAQTVFPALEVIDRVGIPNTYKTLVKKLAKQQLGSPIWQLRDKTAKVLSSAINEQEILEDLAILLKLQPLPQNKVHGRLLCLNYMVCHEHSRDLSTSVLDGSLDPFMDMYKELVTYNPCPVTAATYLDILTHINKALVAISTHHLVNPRATDGITRDQTSIETTLARYATAASNNMDGKWKQLVPKSSLPSNVMGVQAMDPLVRALARHWTVNCCLKHKATSQLYWKSANDLSWAQCIPEDLWEHGEQGLAAGLQTLSDMLEYISRSEVLHPVAILDIPHNAFQYGSKALTMEVWTKIIVSDMLATPTAKFAKLREVAAWNKTYKLFDALAFQDDPEVLNSSLELRGAILACRYRAGSSTSPELAKDLEAWTQMLEMAGNERSGLSTRLAAISSIEAFKTALRPFDLKAATHDVMLRIYCAVYDTLLDDDEEVRAKGATVVSWILSKAVSKPNVPVVGSISLSPPAACARLLDFLSRSYRKSSEFFNHCVSRVIGIHSTANARTKPAHQANGAVNDISLHITSVKDLLNVAREEDTALFVEEKQNLYIDPVQEVERWARLLQSLPLTTFPPELIDEVQSWATEGLGCLIAAAINEIDGPLGWTSKTEVFILGMRVLEAVKLVEMWDEWGLLESPPEPLYTLVLAWAPSKMHPLWTERLLEGRSARRPTAQHK